MSYKSLLFCPDEKTARVVTQVLTELEFTVESSNEPFATVKKLSHEHFDALVVDCQNEQDAFLLFKGARNSSLNHGSLSVAVVEGQAGVAKAFRIGANLVLTKPINIEQSKGTLRVARGLLRKNETKLAGSAPAGAAKSTGAPVIPAKLFAHQPATLSPASPAGLNPAISSASAPAAPFAALELEQDPTPAPEATEVALLESMPDLIDGKPAPAVEPMWAPKSQAQAEPIAASTAGQATAAAPALAKSAELRFSGMSPLVTNEPIIKATGAPEQFPVTSVSVPTFSSLETHASSARGGKRLVKTAAVLLLLSATGYFAWQKLQPLQYLHRSTPVQSVPQPAATPAPSAPHASAAQVAAEPENRFPETTLSGAAPDLSTAAGSSTGSAAPSISARNFAPETIRVQELPMTSEQKNSPAPKPQVIVVRTKPGSPAAAKPAPPAPPSLPLATANNSDTVLANIVTTDVAAPKPVPGSLRVSQGVSQGLVMKKIAPGYPATALQLRKQGTVELLATISKDGAVTRVRVLSGDLILANSAVAAVRQWKYRPYLLNGEPVEIETQITVNFTLPH